MYPGGSLVHESSPIGAKISAVQGKGALSPLQVLFAELSHFR